MAEYIEREKVWRKVNRAKNIEEALNIIDSLPTADVVPVVMCKDCVYWDGLGYSGRCEGYHNGLMRDYTNYDDYCSYGERRCSDG